MQSFREFVAEHTLEINALVTNGSSATVALASAVHGVEPAQIAKTMCLRVGEQTLLVVASGTARLDNCKLKDGFGAKPCMLEAEEVLATTSHPAGSVCSFGFPASWPVYCDVSLRAFEEVVPAAGATNAAVRLTPERLAKPTCVEWVDVRR